MSPPASPPADGPGRGAEAVPRRRPGQLLECGWCGGQVKVARVGCTPKWCSDRCRHRAWEARRASANGDGPVRVVDRTVEVDRALRVVEQVEVPTLPKGPGWAPALHELARQLDAGRVYDRDLGALADGLTEVLNAMHRRPTFRSALTAGRSPRA